MEAYLATRAGNITIALEDLDNGTTYLYRPGVAEQTASIIKVDILATLLEQAQSAHHPLTSEQQYLATGMIEASDDDDATSLWDEAGESSAIGAFDARVGLTDTDPNSQGYWGETTTTALDQLRLLRVVALPNHLLDSSARSYELNLMEHIVPDDYFGVPTGVPTGVRVAFKNGWVPIVNGNWQINSIGWVDGDRTDYLLAILTNGNATEAYGIATTDGIARIVWAELHAKKS